MNGPITVVQTTPKIFITGNITMPTFVPFSFPVVTDQQTVFGPLPFTPTAIACLAVQGALQNQANGDFTVNGLYITLAQGVPLVPNVPLFVFGVEAI